MTWWSWMILGAVLLGAELFAIDAQFYLVFLGLSAALVGAAELIGIAMPEWAQWTMFAVLSLVTMFTFRGALYARIRGGAPGFKATLAGQDVNITTDLSPGSETRTEYRGSDWTVRNVSNSTIAAGTRARIVKSEGLVLHVTAD